ncbi:hypothetical protein N658DRAFT_488509 [Parathielavia hyrcaniae]|uniref:Uncharacterized protein n=1 Tax=Parathielavia hyrcaniae TaxID=113614 RepID=A0AAN6PV17_9PEZI|nr:hypothetical protein N658DRAFT_488509 [Parathielavia hyrcaniae]
MAPLGPTPPLELWRAYLRLSISTTSTDQSQAFGDAQAAVARITSTFRALATKTPDGLLPHPDGGRDGLHREAARRHVAVPGSTTSRRTARSSGTRSPRSTRWRRQAHVSLTATEWRLTEATHAELEGEARLSCAPCATPSPRPTTTPAWSAATSAAVEIRDRPVDETQQFGFSRARQNQLGQRTAMLIIVTQLQSLGAGTSGAGTASEGPSLEPKTITITATVSTKFVSTDDGGENGDAALEVGVLHMMAGKVTMAESAY